jgi:raffinose/stachyose/melibiose transport system permease protein
MNKKRTGKSSYLFLLPAFAVYLSVIILPVIYSFFISFFRWNGISDRVFIGLQNYKNLFSKDHIFIISLKNNFIWLALTIIVVMGLGLIFALVLNKQFGGRTFFRGAFYFPCVIAPIAVSIIWRWMYEPNIGFINQLFSLLRIDFTQSWLSEPKTSLYAVFAANVWQTVGQTMILFLAGLQTVSQDALEAATIDGASSITKFIHITVPYLRETFIIVLATLIIAAMKVFDIVYGLTGGGPNNATQMLSTYMYSQTFQYNNAGIGSTVSCIMVLMMIVVIVPYVIFTAKDE